MKIVPMKTLMCRGFESGYAVPAFNICNMEMMRAVLTAADEMRSPVILGIHPHEVAYFGDSATAVGLARSIGANLDIEVAVHLDHGDSPSTCFKAIRGGFSSVMYDGSSLPLDENIAGTRLVVEVAHDVGVTVEAEIGTIGATSEFGEKLENAYLSDPVSAERLANAGIDCLAVAIGNAHGFYEGDPKLDFDLLADIRQRVSIPLVLHGGTGIPRDDIRRAISMGIAKVNVGTALRYAFVSAMKDFFETVPVTDLAFMTLGKAGMKKMIEPISETFETCMSAGRLAGHSSSTISDLWKEFS